MTASPSSPAALVSLKHCRDRFVDAIRAAARTARCPEPWLDGLCSAAAEGFEEMAGLRERRGFEQLRGLTASRISLIHQEDLDYSIELINLEQRIHDHVHREMTLADRRLHELLIELNLTRGEDSPFGSEVACLALRALTERERINPVEALDFARQIEAPLKIQLIELYRDVDHTLAGVPSYGQKSGRAPAPRPGTPDGQVLSIGDGGHDPVDGLRWAVISRAGDGLSETDGQDRAALKAVVDRIEAWMDHERQNGEWAHDELSTSELVQLLPPPRVAALAVVEAVFAHALTRADLPGPIRALLVELRFPILKQALRHTDLFEGSSRPPALRLVDSIAQLGASLPPEGTVDHSLYRAAAKVVNALVQPDTLPDDAFAVALEALDKRVAERRQTTLERARAFEEKGVHLERREIALHQATRMVSQLLTQAPEGPVRQFLEGYWVQVLTRAAYLRGTDHAEWDSRVRTAAQLIASIVPPADDAERERLRAGLPALLGGLGDGLQAVGLKPETIDAALAPLDALHAAVLDGRLLPAIPPKPRTPRVHHSPVSGFPGLFALAHKSYLAGEPVLSAEWADIRTGDALVLALPDGGTLRGLVAWIGPGGQLMLIADTDRHDVLAVTFRAFAQQTAQPGSRRLRPFSLVEDAADRRLAHA